MGLKPIMSSRSSSSASVNRRHDPLLPYSNASEKSTFRARSILRHPMYRRVFVWSCLCLLVVSLAFFHHRERSSYGIANPPFTTTKPSSERIVDHNDPFSPQNEAAPAGGAGNNVVVPVDEKPNPPKVEEPHNAAPAAQQQQQQQKEEFKQQPSVAGTIKPHTEQDHESDDKAGKDPKGKPDDKVVPGLPSEEPQEQPDGAKWLKFPHLNAYYFGLKTLVSKKDHEPEYPNPARPTPFPQPPTSNDIPKPKPYDPYTAKDIVQCYLDKENQIPAPSIYAYPGVTKNAPNPALGSHELLGIRDDVCFDRFGRFGPYGFGYSKLEGGSDTGLDTESSGSEEVWSESGKISYTEIDWGNAQKRCYEANKHRFRAGLAEDPSDLKSRADSDKLGRIGIVIRLYTGFKWTEHVLLNFRALVNEVALKSGGEYGVHFLLHVRDKDVPIWADEETVQDILYDNIPDEFHSMVSIWSVPQMKLMYPGTFKEPIANPSKSDIHGVYRSAHLPLQVFATQHPEYDHIWNWEMDMRFLGNYYEFFDRIGKWASKQPRSYMWERSERYYIPSYHGSWENFTETVKENVASSGRDPIFGPLKFKGMKQIRLEEEGRTPLPESCDQEDKTKCGVGEEADFISLNPIFDADSSGWVFHLDVTGWDKPPPRRTAIITASRMSRRLLLAMHEEVWRHHHSMFTEMFPPSVALHHGLKAVYAPHPVFLDRAWYPAATIDAAFNGGRDHSTSGRGSPFDLKNEHNHAGASWYFNSEFAGLAWRRWLGYAQMDGRGDGGGRAGEGTERGGKEEEESAEGTGRMCLKSMLVHPIKREHPSEK